MEVTLVDYMGDDLRVANAARVSFNKESRWAFQDVKMEGPIRQLKQSDEKLINYLAKHNHWTPFSHCMITLREKVPIFVARQRFKSTVGFTYNEVSRRYVDEQPEFYTPDVWRKRSEDKKQGSSDEAFVGYVLNEHINDFDTPAERAYEDLLHHCKAVYEGMVRNGVAPEQARMVLPQSMYTEYYTTGSLAAFARAYKLRSEESSQKEIRDLAAKWNEIIEPLFPISWRALVS